MSKKYTGYICAICNQVFTEDDDVVTCPECGTPFHRACYEKAGHCPYEAQHGTMKPWLERDHQRAGVASVEGTAKLICVRCGAENVPDGLFCTRCGSPLGVSQASENINPMQMLFGFPPAGMPQNQNPSQGNRPPVFPQNYPNNPNPMTNYQYPTTVGPQLTAEEAREKIGDYTADEIAAAVDQNPKYYVGVFRRFTERKRIFFTNWGAFFLGPYYLFYRKMYLPGTLVFLVHLACQVLLLYTSYLTIPYATEMSSNNFSILILPPEIQQYYMILNGFFSFILFLGLLSGLFFNFFYKNKISKLIDNTRASFSDKEKELEVLREKGGVFPKLAYGALVVMIAIYILAIVAMSFTV